MGRTAEARKDWRSYRRTRRIIRKWRTRHRYLMDGQRRSSLSAMSNPERRTTSSRWKTKSRRTMFPTRNQMPSQDWWRWSHRVIRRRWSSPGLFCRRAKMRVASSSSITKSRCPNHLNFPWSSANPSPTPAATVNHSQARETVKVAKKDSRTNVENHNLVQCQICLKKNLKITIQKLIINWARLWKSKIIRPYR